MVSVSGRDMGLGAIGFERFDKELGHGVALEASDGRK
jgi:hypothetical protein